MNPLHKHPGGQAVIAFFLMYGTLGGIEQCRTSMTVGIILSAVFMVWFAAAVTVFNRRFERQRKSALVAATTKTPKTKEPRSNKRYNNYTTDVAALSTKGAKKIWISGKV